MIERRTRIWLAWSAANVAIATAAQLVADSFIRHPYNGLAMWAGGMAVSAATPWILRVVGRRIRRG